MRAGLMQYSPKFGRSVNLPLVHSRLYQTADLLLRLPLSTVRDAFQSIQSARRGLQGVEFKYMSIDGGDSDRVSPGQSVEWKRGLLRRILTRSRLCGGQ